MKPLEETSRYKLPSIPLFRGLTFISLVAILALPIYTIFFLSPSFLQYIADLKEEQAVKIAQHMESKLIPAKSRKLEASILSDDVVRKLVGTSRDFNLLNIRILLPDGKIFWSLEDSEIDNSINISQVAPMLHDKKIYTNFYKKGTLDHEGDVMTGDTFDTHVPVVRDNNLIGSFEIYYDVTQNREMLNALIQKFYLTLFPIAFILFCSVVVSCRKAGRNVAKRLEAEADALQKSDELKVKNHELEQLVEQLRERTIQLEVEQKARQQAQEQVHKEHIKRERQRKEFLVHMVQAQEEERARIARELHDETAQTLTAASLNFASLRNKLEGNSDVADAVERLQDLCRLMNQDLYRIVHDLRPAQLDDLGLVPALRFLTDEGQRNKDLKVTFNVIGSVQRLDPNIESVIFRIVQEGLTNVTRHAGVDQATVELEFKPEHKVILSIEDKGKGFDSSLPRESGSGWGLVGIAERVDSVNGTLTIDTAPGHGTKIVVVIDHGAGNN